MHESTSPGGSSNTQAFSSIISNAKEMELTPRQKGRALANLGAAALGVGKSQAAARFFLDAVAAQPDDEQVRTNEVLAHLLVSDVTTSHRKATLLREQYPHSPRLAALWITTAPREIGLREMAQPRSTFRRLALVTCSFGLLAHLRAIPALFRTGSRGGTTSLSLSCLI